jgi:hypothetical protein
MLPIGAFEHCGDRRIKLYGGGGSWNPVTIIEDAVTSVGDAVAPIVEGVSDVGVSIDKGVNDAVPGGWATVGAVAVAIAAPYLAPELFALEGGALATEGAAGLTGGGAFVPAAGSGASFVIPEGAAYVAGAGAGAGGAAALETGYAGASSVGNLLPEVSANIGSNLAPSAGTFGSLNPALPAVGSGATGAGFGISSSLPAGAVLGTGLNGGEIGISYLAGPNGMVATDFLGQPILANSINFGGFPADMGVTGSGILDAANDARKVYNIAKKATSLDNANLSRLSALPVGMASQGLSGSSSQAGGSVAGALPGNLKETSLAAAPVMQGTNMNLAQLKQLYPQLSTVDPRIVQMLTGKNSNVPNYYSYGADQGGSTAFTAQGQGGLPSPGSPGYASISADKTLGQTSFAGSTPTGPFDALSSSGLKAINTGALPGMNRYGLKDGGSPKHQEGEHVPEFITGKTGHFVEGRGDGQSDDIPAMLADGEYVFDADTVAALGNGSSKAGALQLDKMRESIRKHKRSAPHDKIPPKAKSPLEYMKGR